MFLNAEATMYDTYCVNGFGIITPKGNRIGRVGDVSVRGLYGDQWCDLPILVRLEDGSVGVISSSDEVQSESKLQSTVLQGVQHPVEIILEMSNSFVVQSAGTLFYANSKGATVLPLQGKISIHDRFGDQCVLTAGSGSYFLEQGVVTPLSFKKASKVRFATESIGCDTDCGYSVTTDFLVEQDGSKIVVFDTKTRLTHTLPGWKDQGIVVDCASYDHYVKNLKTGYTETLRSLIPNE